MNSPLSAQHEHPPPPPPQSRGKDAPPPTHLKSHQPARMRPKKTPDQFAQSSLKIALKDPKNDPLIEVLVKIGSKKLADVKGIKKIKKGIVLKKLPASGSYKISVTATTILKQKLTGSQTYTACTKGSGKIKLKGKKKK